MNVSDSASTPLPDWQQIDEALTRLAAEVGPAESHGTLCGLLCGCGEVADAHWLDLLGPRPDPADALARESLQQMVQLAAATRHQLTDSALGFEPLLPHEARPLVERASALGDWCRGFLVGLGHEGRRDPMTLPGDAGELVRDLAGMASLGDDYTIDGSEEDEQAFAEIVEYLRVGILLINEELNPTRAAPRPADVTLH